MKFFPRMIFAAALLLAAAAPSAAQPVGGGPGPAPDPWTVNGNGVSYPGCVLVPSTVIGGCEGSGSINTNALYVGGIAVSPYVFLTPGTNTISPSTNGGVLWDNNGVLGDSTPNSLNLASLYNNNLRLPQVVIPNDTMTGATAGAGVLTGTYTYSVTFVTATGETDRNNGLMSSISASSNKIALSSIPVSTNPLVIARKIYRTVAAPVDTANQQLVTTIADNVTTSYVDNTPDTSLGTAVPYINTTGGSVLANANPLFATGGLSLALGRNAMQGGNCYATTSIGANSLPVAASGCSRNTVVGVDVASRLVDGYNNTLIGVHAGDGIVHGNSNVVDGEAAAIGIEGSDNVFIGQGSAGQLNETLNHSIFLGYLSGQYETASNMLYIDSNEWDTLADAKTHSLVYGYMAGNAALSWFTINGALNLNPGTINANTLTQVSTGLKTIIDFANVDYSGALVFDGQAKTFCLQIPAGSNQLCANYAGQVSATTNFAIGATPGITKTCTAMPTAMTIIGGIITAITGGTCS